MPVPAHSNTLESPHDPLPRINGQLVDQAEDARVLDERVIHRREVDQTNLARMPVIAVHDVRDNFFKDHVVEREEEIEPVAVIKLRRDVARVIVDERGLVLQAEFLYIVFCDFIRLFFELHTADMLEAVIEERDERTTFSAAEIADTVPPPVDKHVSDPAWERFLSAC